MNKMGEKIKCFNCMYYKRMMMANSPTWPTGFFWCYEPTQKDGLGLFKIHEVKTFCKKYRRK